MKSKALWWAVPIGTVLALVMMSAALAQKTKCKEFQGVINAYTAQTKTTADGVTTATGPYEVRGPWSLRLKDDGTKADFSAALDMGFSDGWVLTPTGGNGNFDPAARGAHTHHVTVVDGMVTSIANGFQVTGTAIQARRLFSKGLSADWAARASAFALCCSKETGMSCSKHEM